MFLVDKERDPDDHADGEELLDDAALRPEVEQPHPLRLALLDDGGALRRHHRGLPVHAGLLHPGSADRLLENRRYTYSTGWGWWLWNWVGLTLI